MLLNSSAALVAAGKATDLADGIKVSEKSIDSGAALRKLNELIEYLRRCYGANVETRTIREEHVRFPLPKQLRLVMA